MESVLKQAEDKTLARLLQLYPQQYLKEVWSENKGLKEALINEVTQQRDIGRISSFVCKYLTTCKQHVYLFQCRPRLKTLLADAPFEAANLLNHSHIPQGDLYGEHDCFIYVFPVSYHVHLRDPYDYVEVPYLWPMMIQVSKRYCVVRCVKLVRDLTLMFDKRHVKTEDRTFTEEMLLAELAKRLPKGTVLQAVDMNKAIKAMMVEDLVDCEEIRIKQPHQATTYTMDSGYTAKKTLSPTAYAEMQNSPLQKGRIRILSQDLRLNVFGCDPTKGFVDFPQYSEMNATDNVLRAIIERNK